MSNSSDDRPENPLPDGARAEPSSSVRDSLFAGMGEICEAATLRADADGAVLAILTHSASDRELVYATDTVAHKLDELQYTLGEGPCFDAYLDDNPQFHPELTSVAHTMRWPTFAAAATQLGAHALFAFPIPDGQQPMGVLELYRRSAGSLADTQYAAAVGCASAIGGRLQSNWKDHVARAGSAEKAVDAAAASSTSPSERNNPFTRTHIYVASGMVAIQLGVDPDQAVDRLRAYSYSCGRRISSVAADIIARRLTLHE